jgi:hypothetical protein
MIDITKQYQTRDGRKVRILCTDGPGRYPVVGLVDGHPGASTWTNDGRANLGYAGEQACDLIEAPKVITGWVNMYRYTTSIGPGGDMYATREAANHGAAINRIVCIHGAAINRIACIQVSFKEGEGL